MEQKPDIIETKNMNYTKVVIWSEEDKCYLGSALPLIGICCHGDTEEEVLAELDLIVNDWLFINKSDKFTTNEKPDGLDGGIPMTEWISVPDSPCRFNPNVSKEEMNRAYERSLHSWKLDGGVDEIS